MLTAFPKLQILGPKPAYLNPQTLRIQACNCRLPWGLEFTRNVYLNPIFKNTSPKLIITAIKGHSLTHFWGPKPPKPLILHNIVVSMFFSVILPYFWGLGTLNLSSLETLHPYDFQAANGDFSTPGPHGPSDGGDFRAKRNVVLQPSLRVQEPK